MIVLLLFACHVETVCITEEIEVADDDPLGDLGFTVADLVADLEGVRTFPAENGAGAALTAELALGRADSPALFADSTWESAGLRPGVDDDMVLIVCEDVVTVPFDVDLASSDGSVALVAEGAAVSHGWGGTRTAVGGVWLRAGSEPDGVLEAQFDGPDLLRAGVSSGGDPLLAFPPAED